MSLIEIKKNDSSSNALIEADINNSILSVNYTDLENRAKSDEFSGVYIYPRQITETEVIKGESDNIVSDPIFVVGMDKVNDYIEILKSGRGMHDHMPEFATALPRLFEEAKKVVKDRIMDIEPKVLAIQSQITQDLESESLTLERVLCYSTMLAALVTQLGSRSLEGYRPIEDNKDCWTSAGWDDFLDDVRLPEAQRGSTNTEYLERTAKDFLSEYLMFGKDGSDRLYNLIPFPLFKDEAGFGVQAFNKMFIHGGHLVGVPFGTKNVHYVPSTPLSFFQHDLSHAEEWLETESSRFDNDTDFYNYLERLRRLVAKAYAYAEELSPEDFKKAQFALFMLTHEDTKTVKDFNVSDRELLSILIQKLKKENAKTFSPMSEEKYIDEKIKQFLSEHSNPDFYKGQPSPNFELLSVEKSDKQEQSIITIKVEGEVKSFEIPSYSLEQDIVKQSLSYPYEFNKGLMYLMRKAGMPDISREEGEALDDFKMRRCLHMERSLQELFDWFLVTFKDHVDA